MEIAILPATAAIEGHDVITALDGVHMLMPRTFGPFLVSYKARADRCPLSPPPPFRRYKTLLGKSALFTCI